MRVRRVIAALALCTAIVSGPSAVADEPRPLTVGERRVLDGAYLYLASPAYCDPALTPGSLKDWVAMLLRERDIPEQSALDYMAGEEMRLRQIADAAFNGRRGKELCRSIFTMAETEPELREAAPAE